MESSRARPVPRVSSLPAPRSLSLSPITSPRTHNKIGAASGDVVPLQLGPGLPPGPINHMLHMAVVKQLVGYEMQELVRQELRAALGGVRQELRAALGGQAGVACNPARTVAEMQDTVKEMQDTVRPQSKIALVGQTMVSSAAASGPQVPASSAALEQELGSGSAPSRQTSDGNELGGCAAGVGIASPQRARTGQKPTFHVAFGGEVAQQPAGFGERPKLRASTRTEDWSKDNKIRSSSYMEKLIRQPAVHSSHLKSDAERVSEQIPVGRIRGHVKRFGELLATLGSGRAPPRTDWPSRVVDSTPFQFVVHLAVVLNLFVLTYSADLQIINYDSEPSRVLKNIDIGFLCWFVIEVVLRLLRHRQYFFYDETYLMNWLDFVLAVSGLVSIFSESIPGLMTLRILRFLRVLRVLHVITMFKTLRTILKSLSSTILDLFWCSVMIALIIYMFATCLVMRVGNYLHVTHNSLSDEDRDALIKHFGGTRIAMVSLFQSTNGGADWGVFFDALRPTGHLNQAIFLSFIALTTIALLNVILGIFVDHALKNMNVSKDEKATEHAREEQALMQDIEAMCRQGDGNHDGKMNREEFIKLLEEGVLSSFLDMHGFRAHDLAEWFDMCEAIADDGRVDINAFVTGCMCMRGSSSSFELHTMKMEIEGLCHMQKRMHDSVLDGQALMSELMVFLRER